MNNILKYYGFCVLTLLSICLTCRAGEDYGGTANLCADIYIRKPDGSKGYFEIQNRKIKDNRYYIITESGGKIYTFSSNIGSFIKCDRWLRSPFPTGYMEYKADKDCLLKFELYTSAPSSGDKYWHEIKMFVDGKLLPASSYDIRLETENNSLPKTIQKIPYTYKRKKKTYTSYRNKRVPRTIAEIPAAENGGVLINSYRRAIFTKRLNRGESFKLHFEVKSVAEIKFK